MAEGDESAKLWKVNRTIHELVRDRVSFRRRLNNGSLMSQPLELSRGR